MNQTEFKNAVQEQERIIEAANFNIKNLTDVFIQTNKRFEINERIKIISPATNYLTKIIPESQRFAYVVGYEVNTFFGILSYNLKKEKQDGTISLHNDHYSRNDILEKIS